MWTTKNDFLKIEKYLSGFYLLSHNLNLSLSVCAWVIVV